MSGELRPVRSAFQDEETKEKQEEDKDAGLSHGYYLSDLRLVLERLEAGEPLGPELLRYVTILGEEKTCQPERIDLVHPEGAERDAFFGRISEILEVKNAPLGEMAFPVYAGFDAADRGESWHKERKWKRIFR